MKSQRRHQLQQNALADALGSGFSKAEPWVKPAALAVIVLLIGFGVYAYFRSSSEAHRATAATELFMATGEENPETYGSIASEYGDTAAGKWALLAQADLYLGQGIDALYVERDEAEKLLDDAIDRYQRALDSSSESLLVSRAHFGLAKAYESKGELEAAVTQYEKVNETSRSEELREVAQRRAEHLKTDAAQQFYAWFREAPQSNVNAMGSPAGGANLPGSMLPDFPNLQFPNVQPQTPAAESESDSAPPADSSTETKVDQADADSAAENEGSNAVDPASTSETPAADAASEEPASEEPAGDEAKAENDGTAADAEENAVPANGDSDDSTNE